MRIEHAIDEYLSHLRIERGSSPLTIEAYAADLADYLSFLDEAGISDLERVDRLREEFLEASFHFERFNIFNRQIEMDRVPAQPFL